MLMHNYGCQRLLLMGDSLHCNHHMLIHLATSKLTTLGSSVTIDGI